MKMRKILSFVLVLSLVLGSFSMAFAATPSAGLSDIDGSANEDAIQVAYDLGIVTGNPDGTFLPEKAVNRAEFAAMITRALAIPESALAGYTSTTFKDTAGYGWAVPYLAFAQSKGIMIGDGMGNVMPGRTINTNEAVTMVLRAIGYTNNSADLVGTWPANYVTKAQDLGLYKDLAVAFNVDKANAAQVIYNALTVNKVSVNSDGETTLVVPWANLLTSGLKCTEETEVVYYDDATVINLMPYVGAYATKFINEDGEIVAVKEKSTFLTGKFNSAYDEFEADGITYKVTAATVSEASIVNADETIATVNVSTLGTIKEYTLAVDLSGKTIKNIYTAAEWVVTIDDLADAGTQDEIADNELLNQEFALDDDDEIDLTTFKLVGAKSLADIKKDNVVYVYTYGNNTDDIVKVAVGTEIVEGIVTAFNSDDGAKINGKYYENSGDAVSSLGTANVSETVKVWLDAYGEVYDFEVTDGKADKYAVVTATKTAVGYDDIIKLIDVEGTNKTYTLDSDLTVNPGKGQIVVFGLDKDGVVEAMDVTTAAMTDSHYVVNTGLKVDTKSVLSFGGNSYRISSDVVVFTYEGAAPASATDFDASTIEKVSDDSITSASAVYFDDSGVVVAILVPADSADSADDDVYGVVNGKELTVNADNDKVYRLTGFANAVALDKLTSSESKGNLVNHADDEIVLYKFTLNADGEINGVEKVTAVGDGVTGTAMTSDSAVVVKSAGTGYITATAGSIGTVALADNVTYYQVEFKDNGNVDEYSVFNGSLREGYKVWLFDTDTTDAPGYEVVIVLK